MLIYWNKRNHLHEKKTSTLRGFSWYTNMAAVSLFWNTNMVAVTSCENALYRKSRIWEMKEDKYTKSLAKIQVYAIVHMRDIRKTV